MLPYIAAPWILWAIETFRHLTPLDPRHIVADLVARLKFRCRWNPRNLNVRLAAGRKDGQRTLREYETALSFGDGQHMLDMDAT